MIRDLRGVRRFRRFESGAGDEDLALRVSKLIAKAVDERLKRARIICDDTNNVWDTPRNVLDSFSHGYPLHGEDEYLFIGYAVESNKIRVGYSYQIDGDEVSAKDTFHFVHLSGVLDLEGNIQMSDIRDQADSIVDDLGIILHQKL